MKKHKSTNLLLCKMNTPIHKTVLVTGAAGFIGSHVCQALLERGDTVIAVDNMDDFYDVETKMKNMELLIDSSATKENKFRFYREDIQNKERMQHIFEKEAPITHICHLAARPGITPSIKDPHRYVQSNIEGTIEMLSLAQQFSCNHFVFASSSSVYGSSFQEMLSEEDNTDRPISPYAATKKACETLAYTWHHLYGLNCTGLRFFSVYGPRGRPDMAPYKFIQSILKDEPIHLYGDGEASRDFTYIDDIVDGILLAIDRPLGYEIINLGNGRPITLNDFIKIAEMFTGRRAQVKRQMKHEWDADRTCADITKAQQLLGYEPKVPFEVGIQNTIEWLKGEVKLPSFITCYAEEEDSK